MQSVIGCMVYIQVFLLHDFLSILMKQSIMGPLATNNNNAIRKKKTAILPSIENEKLHFTQKKKKKTCTVVWCVKGNALTSHQSPLLFEQMKNILARRVLTLILRPHRQHSPSNFYCFSSFSWPFSTASSPPPPPNNKLFVGGTCALFYIPLLIRNSCCTFFFFLILKFSRQAVMFFLVSFNLY